MGLTKQQILATREPQEAVAWLNGDIVHVAAMTGKARDSFEKESVLMSTDNDEYAHLTNFRARLLVRCLVDENGARLFTNEDADALGEVWCAPLDKVFDVAKRLNGFTAADVEELEKNSAGAPSECSGTT